MNGGTRSDAGRLLRIATFACAAGAAVLVHLAFGPRSDALRGELADAQRQLHSDAVSAAELARLTQREPELAARYAAAFGGNAQAIFLGELARALRRHHVALASTSASTETDAGFRSAFTAAHVSLEIDGSYRDIVGTLADLSDGSQLVRVGAPSLHRAGSLLGAVVPVTIYDASRPASPAPAQPVATPP
jgi:hypothetical protein